ncbi:CRM-domain containing factor CFM3, chloroplastic/mitochondrial [Syzygium oleosum]|uniref:CRM-domain containing factor CFM3, chloroplastic/mitochondrial n=1 Tax=Syzygium oleosum TaxID=219896 RepID=UPI0011D1EA65|nr:CRM-domain containing factor CFM3, chloroplastic/mitochondrial [Syzygium oleosum]
MAFATAKITELPLRNALPRAASSGSGGSSLHLLFASPKPPPPRPCALGRRCLCQSLRTTNPQSAGSSRGRSGGGGKPHSAPWLNKWPPPPPSREVDEESPGKVAGSDSRGAVEPRYSGNDRGQNAIERIVLRLRNLGLGSDDGEEEEGEEEEGEGEFRAAPPTGDERLGDLLRREWIRPDSFLEEDEGGGEDDAVLLPWEKEGKGDVEEKAVGGRKRSVKAPSLAELTIEDEELRRLRRMGMYLRERISVAKAGITQALLEKIHDKWRKEELVRLKFHEVLAVDMKTAHEVVERRTGGLVIWRSGSVMVVYRGKNYEGPASRSQPTVREGDALFVPDVSSANRPVAEGGDDVKPECEKSEVSVRSPELKESLTEEEVEYNSLLDGLGPRFEEWWGTGVLPVDADLLPQKIPGYKTPFRLLPTGMRSRLTNAEMTNLRKVAKSLPCHFALGRNRNHQGLAAAIIKIWEKSLVAKIAVKRGIQNTNNKLMAEELKNLTGGVLLLRNKYYIVIYRGKDFLPPTVATALSERQELAKQIQDVEEKLRTGTVDAAPSKEAGHALAGTLAEFYEAQARWGRDISTEEREKMIKEASKSKSVRLVKRIEHKLSLGQAKKLRAERLLSKIEASMVPVSPDDDQETITDEERTMFRKVGLRMKPYLPLGIRGVFDGVIENMHLHWKHRELVKLITKQKTLAFVEDTARLLEFESGGILVSIESVPKGYALIYYRGKNYRRPISLRPRNLLTKAKALKRSVAMQRHEALSQHISELEHTIEQMKKEVGDSCEIESEDPWSSKGDGLFDEVSELTQSEDDDPTSGPDDVEGSDWEDDEKTLTLL